MPLLLSLVFSAVLFLSWTWNLEPPIRLVNVLAGSGIQAHVRCGGPEKRWIPEANGTGAAWLDFDRDGWLDLLIVNGSTMENLVEIVKGQDQKSHTSGTGLYLYRNEKGRQFQDVTSAAGLFHPYWGTGANAADYNNDGWIDILVTTIGRDLLFKNNGDSTFSEVGQAAGLSQQIAWHTGSAFGDYDSDGDLDLYVAGYVHIQSLPLDKEAPVCHYRGLPVFCGPRDLEGEPDLFYRNNGDGTFTEVTQRVGLEDAKAYYGFSVLFEDLNQDHKIDLFVVNDSCPNYLYINRGDGTFEESGLMSGVAFSREGRTQADMGIAVGDYNNDGAVDLLTTTFSEDYFPFFEQQSPGFFEDISFKVGLEIFTYPLLGWGCGFSDLDNDGDKDLWLANGHVYPTIDELSRSRYFQPVSILENRGSRFSSVESAVIGGTKNSYRGACSGDFNNDGKTDLLVLAIHGSPLLLRNDTRTEAAWIGIDLEGRISNRDAIGAKIVIDHCSKRQLGTVYNGGAYLSRNDSRVHFGLGPNCTGVDQVRILWPRGQEQILEKVVINRYHSVEEPVAPGASQLGHAGKTP